MTLAEGSQNLQSSLNLSNKGLHPRMTYPGLGLQEYMALHILARFTVGHTSFPHGILAETQKKRRLHTIASLSHQAL